MARLLTWFGPISLNELLQNSREMRVLTRKISRELEVQFAIKGFWKQHKQAVEVIANSYGIFKSSFTTRRRYSSERYPILCFLPALIVNSPTSAHGGLVANCM